MAQVRMPYGTSRWQRKRAQLLKQSPLCVFCKEKGKIKAATVADHIIPHKGDMDLFWNGELQSLCKQCHDSTKQRMEKGSLKPEIGIDGWPIG